VLLALEPYDNCLAAARSPVGRKEVYLGSAHDTDPQESQVLPSCRSVTLLYDIRACQFSERRAEACDYLKFYCSVPSGLCTRSMICLEWEVGKGRLHKNIYELSGIMRREFRVHPFRTRMRVS